MEMDGAKWMVAMEGNEKLTVNGFQKANIIQQWNGV